MTGIDRSMKQMKIQMSEMKVRAKNAEIEKALAVSQIDDRMIEIRGVW